MKPPEASPSSEKPPKIPASPKYGNHVRRFLGQGRERKLWQKGDKRTEFDPDFADSGAQSIPSAAHVCFNAKIGGNQIVTAIGGES
jgi:hypothetical protein